MKTVLSILCSISLTELRNVIEGRFEYTAESSLSM